MEPALYKPKPNTMNKDENTKDTVKTNEAEAVASEYRETPDSTSHLTAGKKTESDSESEATSEETETDQDRSEKE